MAPKRFFKNIKKSKASSGKKRESPSNSRSIPAFAKASADKSVGKTARFRFAFPKINFDKLVKSHRLVLKIIVVLAFAVASVSVGLELQRNLQAKQSIDSQRGVLIKELNFWKDFIGKHQNFPDAYFQASILEYKLGDTSKAKMYLEKGLLLDPNSANGRKIENLLK